MKTITDIQDKLNEQEVKDLQTITERINACRSAVTIVLYGSHARREQVFTQFDNSHKQSDYDIMIVTAPSHNAMHTIERRIKGLFDDISKTVGIELIRLDQLNKALEEHRYYYKDIMEQGVCLSKTEKFDIITDAPPLTPTQQLEQSKDYFKIWFEKAKANFEYAKMGIQKAKETGNNEFILLAAFNLQQCVEKCYNTAELTFTRYKTYEHHLHILRKIVKKLSPKMDIPFPLIIKKLIEFFKHLNRAYVDSRYKMPKEYIVTMEQIEYWLLEAGKLIDITDQECNSHIKELTQKAKNT